MPYQNERGVIAEQYSELQAIRVLDEARRSYPLPPTSPESTVRAIFQAVEIALLNLEDLLSRAAADVEDRCFGPAAVKMSWARGFHQVMVHLSVLPHQLGLVGDTGDSGTLRISDSPALRAYSQALRRFDFTIALCADSSELQIEKSLAEESLESNELRLLHLSRICSHETTVWERNLSAVYVPVEVPSYEEFVVTRGMRDAVYDRVLTGDTFFTQFRGLHQIPEILCVEINDRIEKAILEIDADRPHAAYKHLRCANILSAGILASLPPMTDNLVTSDYHNIRENLGLTSGSHSVNLHFHLFRDLYQQLWEALAKSIVGTQPHDVSGCPVESAIRRAAENPDQSREAFLLNLIGNECLQLRSFIGTWRDEHLQLPRNNLGSNRTRSLTGSLDAIKAVKGMRDAARAKDPMQPLASARGLLDDRATQAPRPITEYLQNPDSLDAIIADATGSVTQQRFHEVQARLGVFAKECPFSPPPRRVVSSEKSSERPPSSQVGSWSNK